MKKYLPLLLLYLFAHDLSAQERTLSGILEDNGEPLLFATVAVYRNDILIRGVETDLQGKYAIECMVGDKIEFSYIGYSTKSTIVTEAMLDGSNSASKLKIEGIKSKAFNQRMKDRKLKASEAHEKNMLKSETTAALSNKYQLNRPIINFSIKDGKVLLTKPKSDIEYDIKIIQNFGLRGVAPWHQHKLQTTFSQGRPENGILQYRDQTTGEAHSFGPKISELKDQGVNAYNNSILKPSMTTGTELIIEAQRNDHKVYSHLNHNAFKDIFNKYKFNNTNLRLGYIKFDGHKKSNFWNIDLNINRTNFGNHNFNGYYQKVIQAMMVQSPSFDSKSLSSNKNESFNSKFNHPQWYLDNNSNPVQSNGINLIINHKWTSKNKKSVISNILNLDYKNTKVAEYIHESAIGNNEKSSKLFKANVPSALLVTKLKRRRFRSKYISIELENAAAIAKTDFLGTTNNEITYELSNQLLRNTTTARGEYQKGNLKFAISTTSLLANNQPSNLFNPATYFSYDFKFHKKRIEKLRLYLGVNRVTKEQDLLLDRYNYSSLIFNHHELQSQQLNEPLWLSNNLKNEIKDEFKIGITTAKRYSKSTLKSTIEYNIVPQWNVIFPVLQNGTFSLQNAADYITRQISWNTEWEGSKYLWNKRFGYTNSFELSHFTTEVTQLHTSSSRVPIAGFADVSKNLIEGQPVGVIVGSDYERTVNGDIIIGQNGFPTKAEGLKIIADPTPLFNFNYDLELYVNHFSFKIQIDGQVGGKIWNGTQQTLDYYGVSRQSAEQRTIDNYIFDGVLSDGSKNTIEVALADTQQGLEGNQWTRYGTSGIASDYIKNASHISLKSIQLSYWQNRYGQSNYKLSIYAKNVLTLASFRGFATSYLFEDSISYGLQYFNQPIASEVGTSLTYNF